MVLRGTMSDAQLQQQLVDEMDIFIVETQLEKPLSRSLYCEVRVGNEVGIIRTYQNGVKNSKWDQGLRLKLIPGTDLFQLEIYTAKKYLKSTDKKIGWLSEHIPAEVFKGIAVERWFPLTSNPGPNSLGSVLVIMIPKRLPRKPSQFVPSNQPVAIDGGQSLVPDIDPQIPADVLATPPQTPPEQQPDNIDSTAQADAGQLQQGTTQTQPAIAGKTCQASKQDIDRLSENVPSIDNTIIRNILQDNTDSMLAQQQQKQSQLPKFSQQLAGPSQAIVGSQCQLVDEIDISIAGLEKNLGPLRRGLYCDVRVGHKAATIWTCPDKNLKWDRGLRFKLIPGIDSFHLEIYNKKRFSAEEKIGWLSERIPAEVFKGIEVKRWFPLSSPVGLNKAGSVLLIISPNLVPEKTPSSLPPPLPRQQPTIIDPTDAGQPQQLTTQTKPVIGGEICQAIEQRLNQLNEIAFSIDKIIISQIGRQEAVQASSLEGDDGSNATNNPMTIQERQRIYKEFVSKHKLPDDFLRNLAFYYPMLTQRQQQVGLCRGMGIASESQTINKIYISIVEAKLMKNYGPLRMDLFCRVRVGLKFCMTELCPNGAKNPKWKTVNQINLEPGIDSFHLVIFDKKFMYPCRKEIAWLSERIPAEVFKGVKAERWFPLSGRLGRNKEGSVLISISHKPFLINNYSSSRSNQPMTIGSGGQSLVTRIDPHGIVASQSQPIGEIAISIIEARLARDYSEEAMTSYCTVRVGDMRYRTDLCSSGGKNPKWANICHFKVGPGLGCGMNHCLEYNELFHLELNTTCGALGDPKFAWLTERIPPEVLQGITVERWYHLSGKQGPNKEGSVLVVISYRRLYRFCTTAISN